MEKEIKTNRQIQGDDDVIDLMELLMALRKRLWLLVLAGLVGAVIALTYSKMVLIPTYTASSRIFVMSKESTITSLTDLQIGAQLTADYTELIKSRTVMENTVNALGLGIPYQDLKARVSVSNPSDTRILDIRVVDTDPNLAKTIADTVAEQASEYIASIMEQAPPKIIEYGEVPLYQTSPNVKKNTMMGGMAGVVLAAGVVVLLELLNDCVKTEDDIMRTLGVPVLAVVPELEQKKGKSRDGRKQA